MRLLRFSRSSASLAGAAIVERALLGATTFVVTILLGRWGGPDELGLFIIFFPLLFIAIAIQESLITAPYTVYSADHTEPAARRAYLGGVFANTRILCGAATCALLAAAIALAATGHLGEARVAGALAAAAPFVLLREFARRVVYAELRPQAAVAISGSVSLLQLAMMTALHLSNSLTAPTAFGAMGLSSAIVASVWFYANRAHIQFKGASARDAFQQNWSIGSWSVATQIGEIIRTQMFPWLLAAVASDATAGVFAACAIIAALPTPLHVALSNILLPQFVRELKDRGAAAADRLMWQATTWLSGVMLGYFVVVVGVSSWIVPFVYGPKYGGTQHALIVLTLAQVFVGASLPAARALLVLHRPDQVFYSRLAGVVLNMTLGAAFVSQWGIVGAAYATLIGAIVNATLDIVWYQAEARRKLAPATPLALTVSSSREQPDEDFIAAESALSEAV